MADPTMVRARLRDTLEACGPAFFDETWRRIRPHLAADVRLKRDLLARRGLAETLTSVSPALSLDEARQRIVMDKLQDNSTSAVGDGVTFIPSVFGNPHLVCVHAPRWRPVLQYPIAGPSADSPAAVPLEQIQLRLEALAHPIRIRLARTLARTLARGPHTTGELASAWELSPPEVSRHLTVHRKAGLLTTRRRGRYVHYELDAGTAATLGSDLLEALLR